MKKYILIISIFFSVNAFAQDSTHKQPSYAYPNKDTVQIGAVIYGGSKGEVKYSSPAYLTREGFIINESGKWKWTEQPKVTGALDEKKKPLSKILQVIQ